MGYINTIKDNSGAVIYASKGVGMEGNTVTPHWNAGQNRNINAANGSLWKYDELQICENDSMKSNFIHEENKSR
jgi:hypothetical protein